MLIAVQKNASELLRNAWYVTVVAALSKACQAIIARRVSSLESAALGGLAHLLSFMSADTVRAVVARRHKDAPMAGILIPATEHSTITSWGREHQVGAYRNMLRQFTKLSCIVAHREQ